MLDILPVRSNGQAIAIDGYLVPGVEVEEDSATGQWRITYARRFAITADLEEMQRWLWLIAQAQAIGEGYSCHGKNSVYRPNPHKVQVMQIGSIQSEPMGIQEG